MSILEWTVSKGKEEANIIAMQVCLFAFRRVWTLDKEQNIHGLTRSLAWHLEEGKECNTEWKTEKKLIWQPVLTKNKAEI